MIESANIMPRGFETVLLCKENDISEDMRQTYEKVARALINVVYCVRYHSVITTDDLTSPADDTMQWNTATDLQQD